MNLFHGLLIEDILDNLMQNLELMDATCLARTCRAEYARQTRLRLSAYPLRKTLRRVSRAGNLAQFQFMHKDWEIPFDDLMDAARRTSNVELFQWAQTQSPQGYCQVVLSPNRGGTWRSLALFQHYGTFPPMDSFALYLVISRFDRTHGEAQLIQYLSQFELEEKTLNYMIERTVRNRHVSPVEPILNKAKSVVWLAVAKLAIHSLHLPVLKYIMDHGKVKGVPWSHLPHLLRDPLGNARHPSRVLEIIHYLVTQVGIPWDQHFAREYVNYAEGRLTWCCEPFNPKPVRALLDLGMPWDASMSNSVDLPYATLSSFLWVCENHKRTQ
jgi:hypothetical protein